MSGSRREFLKITGAGALLAGLPASWAGGVCASDAPETPAAVIEQGTTPGQRTATGTLGNIAARAAHLQPPAVIVIGAVAGLHAVLGSPAPDRLLTVSL
jgi:hypothetical protein